MLSSWIDERSEKVRESDCDCMGVGFRRGRRIVFFSHFPFSKMDGSMSGHPSLLLRRVSSRHVLPCVFHPLSLCAYAQ